MNMNKCLSRKCKIPFVLFFVFLLPGCSPLQSGYVDKAVDEVNDQSINDGTLLEVHDLIYSVDKDGELLSEVVELFTADANNSAAVARINDLDPNSFLRRGQLVRIPRYMLKK